MLFGKSTERFIGADLSNQPKQGILLDVPGIAEVINTSIATVTYTKTTTCTQPVQTGRQPLPAHLRREQIVLQPNDVRVDNLKKISEDITETLAYTPAELYVKRTIRPKYLDPGTQRILQAPAPVRAMERSNADESLVAQIIVEKYIDHMPLNRQINRYARLGVEMNASTLSDQVAAAGDVIAALAEAHKKNVLSGGYLHADETTIQVLESDKKNASHTGYYWVYQSHKEKLVYFDYQPGRGREGPTNILNGFTGYLQTDGYGVYDAFGNKPGITLIHCMAHARRKFFDAQSNDKEKACYVLEQMQWLYDAERFIKDKELTGEAKWRYRQEHAVPILKSLGTWMQETYITLKAPDSAISKALAYSIKRWDKLSLYATTDFLNIDNNPVENSIRPVTLGRKNYLFAGSHAAAQRAAIFYSLFATCKNYNINPYNWLLYVLRNIVLHPINRIAELLPQNINKDFLA